MPGEPSPCPRTEGRSRHPRRTRPTACPNALVGGSVNLPQQGLQRHRILWAREMDEQELRRVGERGPTIDRIEVAEFESHEEVQAWLKKAAPAFVRKPG